MEPQSSRTLLRTGHPGRLRTSVGLWAAASAPQPQPLGSTRQLCPPAPCSPRWALLCPPRRSRLSQLQSPPRMTRWLALAPVTSGQLRGGVAQPEGGSREWRGGGGLARGAGQPCSPLRSHMSSGAAFSAPQAPSPGPDGGQSQLGPWERPGLPTQTLLLRPLLRAGGRTSRSRRRVGDPRGARAGGQIAGLVHVTFRVALSGPGCARGGVSLFP